MQQQNNKGSGLAHSIARFSLAIAGLVTLVLVPQFMRHFYPFVYAYFDQEFAAEYAQWCSWGFIALLAFGVFSAVMALCHILMHMVFFKIMRGGRY